MRRSLVLDLRGVISVIYKSHWLRLSELCWGWKMDLQHSRNHMLHLWAGTPDRRRQTNHLYRRMQIGSAQSELSGNNGERSLAPGYACVTRADCSAATTTQCFLWDPTFGIRETMGFGCLEKSARAQPTTRHTWSAFWTTRGRSNFLFPRL